MFPLIALEPTMQRQSQRQDSATGDIIDPQFFARLPLAIQRKCFSPVELLRLEQLYGGLPTNLRGGHAALHPAFFATAAPPARAQHAGNSSGGNTKHDQHSRARRLIKKRRETSTTVSSPELQRWVRALPTKARQLNFDPTEQAAILGTDFAANPTRPSRLLKTGTPSSTPLEKRHVYLHRNNTVAMMQSQQRAHPQTASRASDVQLKSRRSMPMPPPSEKRTSRPRGSSFKKVLSISTGSQRMSQDYPQTPMSPTSPAPRKSFSLPKRSSVTHPPLPPTHSRTPSQYYNDPEARRKLKQFLTSGPESFEEALQFGFPSTQKTVENSAPKIDFSDNDVHTFLRDSTFFDNDDALARYTRPANAQDEDSDCDSERDSPLTPKDYERYPHRLPAVGQEASSHLPYRKDWDTFTGEREMTMHLTLTRPEIRGDGPYGVHVANDSLNVEALPPMQDHAVIKGYASGANGPEPSKMRNLLNRLKRH